MSMRMVIDAGVCTDKGLIRTNNEDNFCLDGRFFPLRRISKGGCVTKRVHGYVQIYAVCDGMGGTEAGETASLAVVEALCALRSNGSALDADVISKEFQRVSDVIYEEAVRKKRRTGTTAVAVLIVSDQYQILHVGDSRAYRLRDNNLTRMTKDHSEVQRLLSMGVITDEEVKNHSQRHVINQYLGMPSNETVLSVSVTPGDALKEGDVFLLCSDGITDMLDDDEIERILREGNTSRQISQALVQAANANGGRDNSTALCLKVDASKHRFWFSGRR